MYVTAHRSELRRKWPSRKRTKPSEQEERGWATIMGHVIIRGNGGQPYKAFQRWGLEPPSKTYIICIVNASVGFGGSCFQKDILNLVYICECNGLPEVANYRKQVIKINDYQKSRFVNRVVSSMFNTVSDKKIAVLGFAFKKDTGDTRETPAIDVCKGLLGDKAKINIYDPQVTEDQIQRDLSMNKFDWDHPIHLQPMSPTAVKQVAVTWDAYEATKNAHGVCILTEWDEFKALDYKRIYDNMQKPAFFFDGRNVVDVEKLRKIGPAVATLEELVLKDCTYLGEIKVSAPDLQFKSLTVTSLGNSSSLVDVPINGLNGEGYEESKG
ncbi:UDP-glucose 6-dehydrogenase 3 [Asimina triloba]